jgi:hypothetical protein
LSERWNHPWREKEHPATEPVRKEKTGPSNDASHRQRGCERQRQCEVGAGFSLGRIACGRFHDERICQEPSVDAEQDEVGRKAYEQCSDAARAQHMAGYDHKPEIGRGRATLGDEPIANRAGRPKQTP